MTTESSSGHGPSRPAKDPIRTVLDTRLSRRGALQLFGLSASAAFLAACGSGGATTAPSAAPSGAPSAAPSVAPSAAGKSGGEFKFACNFEPDSLDSALATGSSSFLVLMNVQDTLVLLSPDDKDFHPYLATEWKVSADGLTYTFKLKDGIKFHDGTAFDATSVKATIDRIFNPDTKSSYAKGLLGPDFESVTVVDPMTAEFKFKKPYPPLLDSLSQTGLSIVSAKAIADDPASLATHPVGTGFMKFASYTKKEKIEFVRNEDYNHAPDIWGHTGPAYIEKYTIVVADEPASRVTALESGDATGIEDTPGQDIARLQADARFQLIKGEIPGHPRGFFMNTERAPLDDINVRRAIQHGMNREEIVQLATFGTQPMSPGPFSPPTPFHSAKADNYYPHDPTKAGELLDTAGWKLGADGIRARNGEQLTLKTIGFAVFRALYEASQSDIRKVGVNLDLQIVDVPAAVEANHRGDHHLAMTGVVASDASNIALLYHSRNYNGYDWSRVQDPAFDKLWDDAAAELDRDKRAALYEQIQLYIMENALCVPMQALIRNNFYAANIKGIKPDARGIYVWLYDAYIEA